jgi:5-methylcytosine-specific restriction endonuclease McrA
MRTAPVNDPGNKVCITCKLEKPRDDFYKRFPDKNWVSARCRECFRSTMKKFREDHPEQTRAIKAAHHEKNKEKINAGRRERAVATAIQRRSRPAFAVERPLQKICRACNSWKPPSEFYSQTAALDGLSCHCAACTKAKAIDWFRKNPDRVRVGRIARRNRKYAADGSYTAADLGRIRKLQKDKCAVCRERLDGRGDLDHIIPLARGGSNWPRNLQWLCEFCNGSKHARDPIDFMRHRGMLL